MRPCPKQSPYRCQAMRDLAKFAPHCMACGKPSDGTIVGAHSNSIRDGHGMGQKAHDVLAYVCQECHDAIDGRTLSGLSRDYRDAIFYEAAYRTTVWLLQEGYLVVRP